MPKLFELLLLETTDFRKDHIKKSSIKSPNSVGMSQVFIYIYLDLLIWFLLKSSQYLGTFCCSSQH